jgi:Ca-activated chloride channel homolog
MHLLGAVTMLALQQERPTFRAATDIVPICASVHTRDGKLLRDLRKEDFEILDNGQRRDVAIFSSELQPLSVAVVIDRSASNMTQILWARRGVQGFVSALRPEDRVSLRTLDSVLTQMTSDQAKLLANISPQLPPDISSPIWESVRQAVASLAAEPQRRVVLMLTDGVDNGAGRGFADLLDQANYNQVTLYAVDYLKRIDFRVPANQFVNPSKWQREQDRARETLKSLTFQTGGEHFLLQDGDTNVEEAFRRIADTLRTQYQLGFESTPDGKTHKLEVRLRRRDAIVRAPQSFLSVMRLWNERAVSPRASRREPRLG